MTHSIVGRTRGILYSLLLGAFTLDCSAQTLADVARQERERQQRLHSTVVVVNGATTTTTTSTSSTGSTVATDNKGYDEKYWRTQFQKARAELKAAEDKAQLADLKMKELYTLLLRQSDIHNREYRLGPEITSAQLQLDDARKGVEQAKRKISDLEDELRRSGGLPGWAR